MANRGRPPKKRKQLPEGVWGVLCRALSRAGLTEQVVRLEVMALWPQAVGPRIAARTRPQSFSRGTLVVCAATSTWQHELMFLRETIVQRLNEQLGRPRVRALKVISGTLDRLPQTPQAARLVRAPSAGEQSAAHDCAEIIGDSDVRLAFANLMARGLTSKGKH